MATQTAWTQHPVISTVLWIFGTIPPAKGGTNSPNGDSSTGSPTGSTLKWKDEKGGSINEYISQVQTHEPSCKKREEETQLRPGASKKLDGDGERDGVCVNGTISPAGDYTPSPQWGFYVAITPPQEVFNSRSGSLDHPYSPTRAAATATSIQNYFSSQQKH
jgi:hypothetical protein